MTNKGNVWFSGEQASTKPKDDPTDWESQKGAREQAGWHLKLGYAAIFNENYVIGDYTYYCDIETTPSGHVWRIPTKDLP